MSASHFATAASRCQILNKPQKAVTGAADSALLSRWKLLQAERKRLRAEELALRDKLRAHPSAMGTDEESAAVMELPQLREELEGLRGELAAAEARLAEMEPAALRAPCNALAARAVHAVVVGAMAAEMQELRAQLAAQAASQLLQAAAVRASDARATSLEADLGAAVAQLSARDAELANMHTQLTTANDELTAAREQLAARESAPPSTGRASTRQQSEAAAESSAAEESDSAASNGPKRSSRKRGTVDLLEDALEDARPRRQRGRCGLPSIPDKAEDEAHVAEEIIAVRAKAKAAAEAEAEAIEAIGEAAHGGTHKRGRSSRAAAHTSQGPTVGDDGAGAKWAFGSRLARGSRSSIYGCVRPLEPHARVLSR